MAIVDLAGRVTPRRRLRAGAQHDQGTGQLRPEEILLNLKDVTYIDSAGLGEMVGVLRDVTNMGGSIKLLHPQAKVHDLLQVTKLYTVFVAFDDEAEATPQFRRGRSRRTPVPLDAGRACR